MEEEQKAKEKKQRRTLLDIYDKEYKKLLIIPVVILILSLALIGIKYAATGEFVERGVSLKGGLTITVFTTTKINEGAFEKELSKKFPSSDISVRSMASAGRQIAITISATDLTEETLLPILEGKFGALKKENYAVEVIGSSLGASFFKEVLFAILAAFLAMSAVVFLYFRIPVPSLAVILAAFSNMVFTLAVINLLGVKLSTAGISAFLMIIGYSIDTDILLTVRVLKVKTGTVFERVLGAVKTGMTMTFAAIAAVLVAFLFSQSDILKQIMLILLIGLVADIFNTWLQNVGILRWYLEKKARKNE